MDAAYSSEYITLLCDNYKSREEHANLASLWVKVINTKEKFTNEFFDEAEKGIIPGFPASLKKLPAWTYYILRHSKSAQYTEEIIDENPESIVGESIYDIFTPMQAGQTSLSITSSYIRTISPYILNLNSLVRLILDDNNIIHV